MKKNIQKQDAVFKKIDHRCLPSGVFTALYRYREIRPDDISFAALDHARSLYYVHYEVTSCTCAGVLVMKRRTEYVEVASMERETFLEYMKKLSDFAHAHINA